MELAKEPLYGPCHRCVIRQGRLYRIKHFFYTERKVCKKCYDEIVKMMNKTEVDGFFYEFD
ncbi:MAG: hypothetical protein ACXACY_28725 [Candidatus Hodarchaeales archaeon]|jgi:hypothetical protein